ncbi:MAG: methyl-accepting chemotaxis protein [Candidatus Promineifilaceae bacterium]
MADDKRTLDPANGRSLLSNWPFATKLLALVLIITLIPQLIAGASSLITTNTNATAEVGRDVLYTEAAVVTVSTAQYLASQIQLLQTLSHETTIRDVLQDREAFYGDKGQQQILDDLLELDAQWLKGGTDNPLIRTTTSTDPTTNPIGRQLSFYSSAFQQQSETFVTDMHGATLATTNLLSDYYQADEGWWESAANGGVGAIYIGEPEFDVSVNANVVQIAVPVMNDSGNKLLGVIRSSLPLTGINSALVSASGASDGSGQGARSAFVLAGDGTLIAGSTLGKNLGTKVVLPIGNRFDLVNTDNNVATIRGFTPLSLDADNNQAEVADVINRLNWTVGVEQAQASATQIVTSGTIRAFAISMIAALIGIALAYPLINYLLKQLRVMSPVFQAIDTGDYQARIPILTTDELGQTAANINGTLDNLVGLLGSRDERDAIQSSIMQLLEEVSTVAEGDLTVEAQVSTDVTGAIADSFNFMIEQLREIISNVQTTSLQVSSAANEIQTTAEHLVLGSESQATQIVDTTAAIDEMAVSIQQVSENSSLSTTISNQALASADKGASAVSNSLEGMGRIRQQVQATSKRIKRLGESSQEIGEIVQLIRGIAKRTSILSLNAAIQAARAGEAGRSFAVVAEEVERLAERASEATKQINDLTSAIQTEIAEAVTAMEATTEEVVTGTELNNEVATAFQEIQLVSKQLAEVIQSTSLATQQQARGSETIARSMNEISEITQQTAAGTKQATVSIGNLARLTDELRSSVSAFKVGNGYAG